MKAKDVLIFLGLIIVIALIFVGIKFSGILGEPIPEEQFLVADNTAVVEVNGDEFGEKPKENKVEESQEPENVVETPDVQEEPQEEPQEQPQEVPQGKVDQFAGNTDHGINAVVSIDQKMNYNGMEIYYYKNYRNNYVLTIKRDDNVNEIAEVINAAFVERIGNTLYYFKDMDGRCTFYSYNLIKNEETTLEVPADIKVVGMNSYNQTVLLKVENYSEVEGGNALLEYDTQTNTYKVVAN